MRRKLVGLLVVAITISLCLGNLVTAAGSTPPKSSTAPKSNILYPLSDSGKFYYLNDQGQLVFKTNYGFADDFSNGVAKVATELGAESGYVDSKGKKLSGLPKGTKYDLETRGVREIKNGKVVDLSKKVKKYETEEDGMTVGHEDYDVGDGFIVKITRYGGAPKTEIFKNGKIFVTNDSYLENKDIFLIVKYSDTQKIRILYYDYADEMFKTTMVNYYGSQIWANKSCGLTIKVNGYEVSLSPKTEVKNGVVYCNAGSILGMLGYSSCIISSIDNSMTCVNKNKREVKLVSGSKTLSIEGKVKQVNVEPKLYDRYMIVNLKKLAEAFGAKYNFNSKTGLVTFDLK